MDLIAICFNPLLCILEGRFPGIQIGRRSKKTSVVAYADDVTIFVTSSVDIQSIWEAISWYEAASGARLNILKSKAMAISSWDTSTDVMGIPYDTDIKIQGFRIHNTVAQSANNSWSTVTGRIRPRARDAYSRDLCLNQRILYVHNFLLAKAWYTAQIFHLLMTAYGN